jgi:hypothetical protein
VNRFYGNPPGVLSRSNKLIEYERMFVAIALSL